MPKGLKRKKKNPPFEDVRNPSLPLRVLHANVLEFGSIKIHTELIWKNKDFGNNKPERWVWRIELHDNRNTDTRSHSWTFPFEQWDVVDRFRRGLYLGIQFGVYDFMMCSGMPIEEEEKLWAKPEEAIENGT